jgi:hypothetical protein
MLAVLGEVDFELESEIAALSKLSLLSDGLASDLLTGRVRIPKSELEDNS